jgi:4-hydroxybenzoate polyprenyltransferase
MTVALRILWDAALYRFRRYEMANIYAALSISIAIGLSVHEAAYRVVFLALLNVLALLGNDCFDVEQDLLTPGRDPAKPRFLRAHMPEAVAAQVAVGVLLAVAAAAWSRGLLVVLVLGEANCLLYSWKLKRIPLLDVASIGLWGLVMPMAGFPLDSSMGWCLALQLMFFSAAFELMQVMRDREVDVAHGVTTTAVRLGHRRSVLFLRLVIVAAAAFGVLVVHRWICLGILASLLVPVREGSAARAWNHLRVALGVVWLAVIAWVVATGSTDGLVASVGVGDSIGWLEVAR